MYIQYLFLALIIILILVTQGYFLIMSHGNLLQNVLHFSSTVNMAKEIWVPFCCMLTSRINSTRRDPCLHAGLGCPNRAVLENGHRKE